jgi:hypothetical protein
MKNYNQFINEEVLKSKNIKKVDVGDWDDLVSKTYGKPYNFQQQDDCQERGIFYLTIPSPYTNDEEMHDSIPEKINGEEMGVKFKIWLERDPKQLVGGRGSQWEIDMFWDRNFYPDINTVANDLYDKGLIEKGEYGIDIDW